MYVYEYSANHVGGGVSGCAVAGGGGARVSTAVGRRAEGGPAGRSGAGGRAGGGAEGGGAVRRGRRRTRRAHSLAAARGRGRHRLGRRRETNGPLYIHMHKPNNVGWILLESLIMKRRVLLTIQ